MSFILSLFGICWPHEWLVKTINLHSEDGDFVSIDIRFCNKHDCGKIKLERIYFNGEQL